MKPMEPFESADNFNEDIGLFEAATHAPVESLPIPTLKTITIAMDGSARDATGRGFAEVLAARTGAKIEELSGLTSSTDIMAALAAQHSDLLILPVPFGQNYEELGSDSLGSIADQLLLNCQCPILCLREVQDSASIQAALNSVLIPIAVADEHVPRALGWGFRVTPVGGRLDLVAVADRDVMMEACHLMPESTQSQSLAPDQLSRAILRDIGGLVGMAQKQGVADGRQVHVETRVGHFVPLTLEEMHGKPHLIIWGITRDHSSPAFHRAVALLLSSTGAVFMV